MAHYTNATPFTRVYEKFEYHLEDMDCSLCLYYKGKKYGCTLTACCCEDIRNDCVAHDRIKRKLRRSICRE